MDDICPMAGRNRFIALNVNTMHGVSAESREAAEAEARHAHDERVSLARQIEDLASEVRRLRESLRER